MNLCCSHIRYKQPRQGQRENETEDETFHQNLHKHY